MDNTMHRLILENQFSTLRLLYSQMGETLRVVEKMLLLEEDQPEPPVPGFDPKKLYRCRDPEFHVTIHHTCDRHYGTIWKNGTPSVYVNWDLDGKYGGAGPWRKGWDLVNYSTPDLDSSCGE